MKEADRRPPVWIEDVPLDSIVLGLIGRGYRANARQIQFGNEFLYGLPFNPEEISSVKDAIALHDDLDLQQVQYAPRINGVVIVEEGRIGNYIRRNR